MDIDKYLVSLEKIIINIDQCYGHRDDDHQETINEHIQLCTKYLKEIFKLKKLDSILKSFNISLGEGLSNEGKEMFNELFFNTITFHDTGKINPFFQKNKMNNPVMNYLNPPKNLKSDHSKLSAYIYLGTYLNKLNRLSRNDIGLIKPIVYINAFVISRHHAKIDDFRTYFMDKLDSDDILEKRIIEWMNDEKFISQFTEKLSLDSLNTDEYNYIFEKLEKYEMNIQIDLYAYVRFLYSLLVFCDYYATSEFYGDNKNNVMLKDADFGEIIELYDNSELVTKIRKNDIGKEKINALRTKVFLEAERNLLENIDKNIFYLEAPTGSGKSNTALNLSLRLKREKIISTVKTSKHLILVATQVIEAGVDIDMDIGYKDISKLDSEEQFMGRINRSCKEDGKGIVYFFNLNKATNIYKGDERVAQKNLTLFNDDMKKVLLKKNFNYYYQKLLKTLANRAKKPEEKNVPNFFRESVACLDYQAVSKRMELILDTRDRVTIFLGRTVINIDGEEFDGKDIWNQYVDLLKNNEMDYAKKVYELSVVKSMMNYFMYQVIKKNQFDFKEQVGDIYYIENGDDYILDGKLNTALFETEDELFI